MGRAYLIVSGKGGTGKTTVSTSLALALAQIGRKVLIFDGDVGLRCCDLLMGMEDMIVYDAGDVLENRCTLEEAATAHPNCPSLRLLSAPQMATPGDMSKKAVAALIEDAKAEYDDIIIDCPAGIGRGLKNVWQAADEAILVATPDDASLRAAERVAALLFERRQMHASLLLNRIDRVLISVHEEKRPGEIAAQLDMPLIGGIPESYDVYRGILMHKTALECDAASVRRAIRRIAKRMTGETVRFPKFYRVNAKL